MARYLVRACDQYYQGLHGMESVYIAEGTYREVEEEAEEESYNVIQSYHTIYEEIEADVEEWIEENPDATEEEIEEYREEITQEDVNYFIYEINEEKCGDFSSETLEKMYDSFEEEFILKFCIPC